MELKFDSKSIQEILQVIIPLRENIPCSLIVKDAAKRKDSLPRNDSQYKHIFDKLFVTVEMELVKLAIASLASRFALNKPTTTSTRTET